MSKYWPLLFLLLSCSNSPSSTEKGNSPHTIHSVERIWDSDSIFSSYGLYRTESDEAVCYIYQSYQRGGISCKFKEARNVMMPNSERGVAE